MPVKSEIDKDNNVIIRKVVGELTLQDIKDALVSTPQLAGFEPDMGVVWDYSEGTNANFGPNEIKKLAQSVEQWSQGRGSAKYRSASFAPRDIEFGLSRMYQAFIEIRGVSFEFSVFRELDQAIRWVNKIEPQGDINVPLLNGFSSKQG
jgi:hypothetical protein